MTPRPTPDPRHERVEELAAEAREENPDPTTRRVEEGRDVQVDDPSETSA